MKANPKFSQSSTSVSVSDWDPEATEAETGQVGAEGIWDLGEEDSKISPSREDRRDSGPVDLSGTRESELTGFRSPAHLQAYSWTTIFCQLIDSGVVCGNLC
jgi:hypothetical protein